jgi:UPF0755 protein
MKKIHAESVKKKKSKRFIFIVAILLIAAALCVAGYAYFYGPMNNGQDDISVTIESGSSVDSIASALKENDLIRSKIMYKIYIKILGKDDQLKAGTYLFSSDMDASELTAALVEGAPADTITITIKEGWDLNRIGDYLESTGLFTKQEFLDEIENNFGYYAERYEFLADVPEDRTYKLEGYLFGDTYEVYADAEPRDVILKMLDRFDEIFKDEYYDRCEELGMTVDEVVTMASIVEREGILDSELPTIASVFYNRLDAGMLLQSCATLQYIYQDYQFTFSSKQMEIDSPYNTYKYKGLPAGPISNFRETALEAALYPADTDYYYFCSKNDGTGASAFATTLAEHEANIEKYSDNWD